MTNAPRACRRSALAFRDEAWQKVPVHIGDVKVAEDRSLLFTIGLGSCVAVSLYDADARIGGLAHAMLPDPGTGRHGAPAGRFATTAVPALIGLMEEAGAARERLRAHLVGGASMFRDVLEGEGLRLGRRNVEAARRALDEAGVPLGDEDVFGTYGRSVFLRTVDGRVLVTSVRHDDVLL